MRNPDSSISCDLLVIGAGLAGITAAMRAAQKGLQTVLVGSTSSFYLYSGLMDLLDKTSDEFDRFQNESVDHPYAKISRHSILEGFDFIQQILERHGLKYIKNPDENIQVVTAAGTLKSSFMVPFYMASGALSREQSKQICLVGFKGMKGFSASFAAAGLRNKGFQADSLAVSLPGLSGDLNATRIAAGFQVPSFLDEVIRKIKQHLSREQYQYDAVGFPAICGIEDHHQVMETLQQGLGVPCFEIPGLPPSIPGLRLKQVFENHLSEKEVIQLPKHRIHSARLEKEKIRCQAICGHQRIQITSRGGVLATGRFPSGGLKAERNRIVEPLFNIPVSQPESRSHWHEVDLFHPKGHKINQAGIRTDKFFRPLDAQDNRINDHLYAAGGILSGNDWVRLKSGAGVSITSALKAVDHFNA